MKVFRDIPRRDIGRHAPKPRQYRPAADRARSYDRSRRSYQRGPRRGSNAGGSGKSVYIFVALLLIIAGIVYIKLNDAKGSEQGSDSTSSESDESGNTSEVSINTSLIEGEKTYTVKIYRVYDGTLDTSKGRLLLAEGAKAFTPEQPDGGPVTNAILGAEEAEIFTNADGNVSAVTVSDLPSFPERIRVVLQNAEGGYLHASAVISCDQDFWVQAGEEIYPHRAGEAVTISPEENADLLGKGRFIFCSASENGKFTVQTLTKGDGGNPSYRGNLEVALEEGGYTLVNEVFFEQYLYAVIPSEMPTGYGVEAAKVQAVCSRSYAYNQWKGSERYAQYGAHVDDSVSCQVYNSVAENETSIAGVEATRGMLLLFEQTPVSANFFSTSCGHTASAGDVWANTATEEFPTASAAYLIGQPQYTEGDYGDLSQEDAFHEFIKNMDVNAYDKESPWFRWNVTMTQAQLQASVEAALGSLSESRPYLIKTLKGDVFESEPVTSVGVLQDIYAYSRAESGIITELLIVGSDRTVKIGGENSIRTILAPVDRNGGEIALNRKDGSAVNNYSLLPSAFFTMEKTKNTEGALVSIMFYGGGNGHGVGMSQEGVKGMIDAGISWDEILKHFYPGVEMGFLNLS
ncbi:SpoIID/LytB domain-containing protein [Bianquea renquensis]|uniref:SpoIID/LytB domain-containing protein n=1 Tax=Bianquea renquensis TaxID=2763661 RepID=A0A926HX62_9FIRM|nr:SpoIID/LytB domain-containing protein [Bianquea renquensis]MBC8543437.1 SpoIID/LytB domain-containing protein [Bianquea renquensis]